MSLNIPPGLIRFCLQHGDNPEAAVNPNRDPRDYEWLREALGNLENDYDKMKKIVSKLTELEGKEDEASIGRMTVSLEELQYYIEDIDNANELNKMGGLALILRLLSNSKTPKIRMFCAWILTNLVQNNPKGQKDAAEQGAIALITKLLPTETDEETRVKLLSALSGFLSENKQGQQMFLSQASSYHLLKNALQKSAKEQIRALSILRNLAQHQGETFKDHIREFGVLDETLKLLDNSSANNDTVSKAVLFLTEAIDENPENAEFCAKKGVRPLLSGRLERLRKQSSEEDDYTSEIESTTTLLNLLSTPQHRPPVPVQQPATLLLA